MPDYQYRIITPDGKEKKGTLSGKSAELVEIQLKSEQNIVLSVEEASVLNKDISISFGNSVKPRDLSIFCRQFVSIIGAGVSIVHALEMLSKQTESKHLRKAIESVYEDVSKGETLAGAMKKHKRIFPGMLCNMVEAGEASGSLEIAFARMANQFEKDYKLKASVKKAMIYPIMIVVAMIIVVIAMLAFVIPNFMEMFADMDMELPAPTQIVVAMSDFVIHKWWLLILIIIAVVGVYKAYTTSDNGKYVMGMIKLKIPVFGKLQTKTACAKLGRTLSTLLGAGVPMMEAIDITARNMDNVAFRLALLDAKEQVSRGVAFSKPLKTSSLFPPMVLHMISVGEETGNLEDMLENIANYYEEEVEVATEQLTALMEPIIILVMAVVVGGLVIAMMAPMFQLYNGLDSM